MNYDDQLAEDMLLEILLCFLPEDGHLPIRKHLQELQFY